MNNDSNRPSISSLKSALYTFATKNYTRVFISKIAILSIALIAIVGPIWIQEFDQNPYIIWGLLALVIGLQFAEFFFRNAFKTYYEKAEEARKLELVKSIFLVDKNIEIKFLFDKVGEKILDFAIENPKPLFNPDTQFEDRNSRMVEQIQANCFFTSSYFYSLSKKWFLVHLGYSVLIAAAILFSFFIISLNGNENNIPKISLEISQILGVVISSFVGFSFWDNFQTLREKSRKLEELAKRLEVEKQSPNEDEVILIFSEFNSIVCDAELFPNNFWKIKSKSLLKLWKKKPFSKSKTLQAE